MSLTRVLTVGLLLVVLGAVAYAVATAPLPGTDELARRLENLGTVVVVGGEAARDLSRLEAEGTALSPADELPALAEALSGTDEEALARALDGAHVSGLLIDGRTPAPPEDTSLGARLSRYEPLEVLGGAYLTPLAALYLPRNELVIRPPLDEALAHVARALIGGARPPRVRSFPEPLRRIRSVEVMVMLEERGRARLWRSARGSSIGRALMTAAVVARQRWTERETAMGGPISRALPHLDVVVYLLDEDGTIGVRSRAFIDRVFGAEHGVAFDEHGPWHYLLPDATRERGEGSAVRAYQQLFSDSDMPEDSFDNANVRLYRMLARELARSPAPGLTPEPSPFVPVEERAPLDTLAPPGLFP